MFIKIVCACGSRDVMHFRQNRNRLDQYCQCGNNLTAPQIRKQVRTRRLNASRKPKMPRTASKRTKSQSTTLALSLSIWAILSVMAFGATAYAEWSEPIVYTAEVATSTNKVPEFVSPVVEDVKKPETLIQKIDRHADQAGIPRWKLHALAQCESSMNPKAKNVNSKEISHGLYQINIKVHDVSVEQAQDPDFALSFVVKHWKKRYNMWYMCSRANSL